MDLPAEEIEMSKMTVRVLALIAALAAACDRPAPLPEAPTIALSATSLAFTVPTDGSSSVAEQSIAIRNAGGGALAVPMPSITLSAYAAPPGAPDGWLSAAVVSERGGYRLLVKPNVEPDNCYLAEGRYVATVRLDVPGAVNSPRTVQVALHVPPPVLAPLPASLSFVAPLDGSEPAPQVFTLRTWGGHDRPTARVPEPVPAWLSMELADAPGLFGARQVTVRAHPGQLRPGTHHGLVGASLGSAGAPGIYVPTTLEIAPARLRATPATLHFSAVMYNNPVAQGIEILNDGRRTPDVPTVTVTSDTPWLGGELKGSSFPFQLVVSARADLPCGSCSGVLSVNVPNAPGPLSIPVTLDRRSPRLLLSPTSVDFVAPPFADPAPVQLTVTEESGAWFSRPQPLVSDDWLLASVSGSAPPYSLELRARTGGLPTGLHQATATVFTGPDNLTNVRVTLRADEWAVTRPNSLRGATTGHAVVSDGFVFVFGGGVWRSSPFLSNGYYAESTDQIEYYAPSVDRWLDGGRLREARSLHTATSLDSGRILVVGGYRNGVFGPISDVLSYEVYMDPIFGVFASGPLQARRTRHTATLLGGERVLVAGGAGEASAEVIDRVLGSTPTGTMSEPRESAAAVRLPSGKVLIAGGRGESGATATAELYDPTTGTWSLTGPMGTARSGHALVLLGDGRALAIGGSGGQGAAASAEVYDPAAGIWSPAAPMAATYSEPRAVTVPSGKVLVEGGSSAPAAEVYDPSTDSWSGAGTPQVWRRGHSLVLGPGGRPLLVGGDPIGLAFTAEGRREVVP